MCFSKVRQSDQQLTAFLLTYSSFFYINLEGNKPTQIQLPNPSGTTTEESHSPLKTKAGRNTIKILILRHEREGTLITFKNLFIYNWRITYFTIMCRFLPYINMHQP